MSKCVLALILYLPLRAADVEVWNGVELEVFNTNRWIVRGRIEARSTDAFRDLLQVRGVGDVRFAVNPRFSLVSLFHVVEGKSQIGWEGSNRLMGGFELPFRGESRTVTSRTLVEKSFLPNGLRYHRYRQRFSLRWTRHAIQPQGQIEIMVDSHGWANTRPTFSVRVPVSKHVELDLGYHYEFRPLRLGGNRQMVFTYLRIKRQVR